MPEERVEDRRRVRLVRLGRNALDDVIDPDEERCELRARPADLGQLDVDHVARREAVHAEVRDELEERRPGGGPNRSTSWSGQRSAAESSAVPIVYESPSATYRSAGWAGGVTAP